MRRILALAAAFAIAISAAAAAQTNAPASGSESTDIHIPPSGMVSNGDAPSAPAPDQAAPKSKPDETRY
jgi:hypothetical protein